MLILSKYASFALKKMLNLTQNVNFHEIVYFTAPQCRSAGRESSSDFIEEAATSGRLESTTSEKELNADLAANATATKGIPIFFQTRCLFSLFNCANSKKLIPNILPPQTMNEKRSRLESYLIRMLQQQQQLNEDIQPLDLSYLLTGRGARRRTNLTNVPLRN